MTFEFIAQQNAQRRNRKNAEARVREIRDMAKRGLKLDEIAKRLCLHISTIRKALR